MKGSFQLPATSANIGPGFDVWGIALSLKNDFSWELSPSIKRSKLVLGSLSELVLKTNLGNTKKIKDMLTNSRNNLLLESYISLFKMFHKKPPPVEIKIDINVPLSRGLGSSATVILAGFLIAREILQQEYRNKVATEQIFEMACKKEGHPDNIAACLYGGLVLNLQRDQKIYPYKMPFKAPVKFTALIPDYEVSTKKSRVVLPEKINYSDVAFQSSRMALLSVLFSKKKWRGQDQKWLKIALSDKIHQPFRLKLLKGARETFEYWHSMGALGSYISGSGSTLMGIWPKKKKLNLIEIASPMRKVNVQAVAVKLEVTDQGKHLSPPSI